jgi:glutamate transport system substrate-binding protein
MTSNDISTEGREPEATPERRPPAEAGIGRELPWLIVLAVAVIGLTVYLLRIGPQGSDIANILALSVAIAGLAVPVVLHRLARRPARTPRTQTLLGIAERKTVLLALTTTTLGAVIAATSIVIGTRMMARGDEVAEPTSGGVRISDPVGGKSSDRASLAQYLSGEVTIGINGTLPGWSESSSPDEAAGFDVALVEFLQDKYSFTPKYKKVRPGEREQVLASGEVKLVVANYSMTTKRDEEVDFAGPYFRDRSGILCNDQKIRCDQDHPIPQDVVCVTKGTTAAKNLSGAQMRDSIVECMDAFYNSSDNSIAAISTDLTILQSYGHRIGSVGTVTWADQPDHPISEELYGIGLPDNSPKLCQELSAAVDEFLASEDGWGAAFARHLPGTDPFGRNPGKSDRQWCHEPLASAQ